MIKRVLIQALKFIVSASLILLLIDRIGIHNIGDQISSVRYEWIVLALIIFTASHFLGTFQWWLILRSQRIDVDLKKVLSFYYVGIFFNNFLIGGIGGDFFRMIDIHRYSSSDTGAVSSVFLDRFVGLLVLSAMAVFAIPWMFLYAHIPLYYRLFLLVLILCWIVALIVLYNRSFARYFYWLIRRAIPKSLHAKVREVYDQIHGFGKRGRVVLHVLLISVIIQSGRILMHYFVGRSLGAGLSPLYFFLIIPFVAIMASLPVSAGGIGIRESTASLLFGLVGLKSSISVPMEFMAYLVAVVASLPGFIIFITRKKIFAESKIVTSQEG